MIKIVVFLGLLMLYGVVFKKKNWILVCVSSWYAVLPSYFAIEASESLPLLTVSRILILALLFKYIYANQKRGYAVNGFFYIKRIGMLVPLGIYSILRILSLISHFNEIAVLNEVFTLLFEEIMLVYLMTSLMTSENIVIKCVRGLVNVSGVVCLLGIIEALTGWKWGYVLTTVSRSMLQASQTRLGISRAEATFGHSVYFGLFCVVVIPLTMYLYENTKRARFLIILGLNCLALILTGSRGVLVAFFVVLIIMVLQKNKDMLRKYYKFVLSAIFLFIIALIFVPSVVETITDIIKSLLNALGASYELADYGGNQEGTYSRIMQLSAIVWVARSNLLFGMGPGAQTRGLIKYFSKDGKWVTTNTYDVGYIGIFGDEGLMGLLAHLFLFGSALFCSIRWSDEKDASNMNNAFKYCFIGYYVCLLSMAKVDKVFWIVFSLFVAYNCCRYRKRGEFKRLVS